VEFLGMGKKLSMLKRRGDYRFSADGQVVRGKGAGGRVESQYGSDKVF